MKKTFQIKNFVLNYTDSPKMDGGGTSIGLDFINILEQYYPNRKFNYCLEWCSGPGFIGFNLLLNNYCNKLCLVDIFNPALEMAKQSIQNTNLPVNFYCLESIQELPSTEEFDLIVANPPHFPHQVYQQECIWKNEQRIYLDKDWQIHFDFFSNIKKNLLPHGVILLQESSWACNSNTFDNILHANNLKVSQTYNSINVVDDYPIFYIEITHQ